MRFLYHFFILVLFIDYLLIAFSCQKSDELEEDCACDTEADSIAAVLVNAIDTLAHSVAMKHDGAYYTQAYINRAKANLTVEPWASGWNKLTSNSHAQVSYKANPVVKLVRGGYFTVSV